MDATKFVRIEAKVVRQFYLVQPELSRNIVSIDVDMRRFADVVTVEIDTIRPGSQYRWHTMNTRSISVEKTSDPASAAPLLGVGWTRFARLRRYAILPAEVIVVVSRASSQLLVFQEFPEAGSAR